MHQCRSITLIVLGFVLAWDNAALSAQTASKDSPSFHLLEASIDDVHRALRSRQISCRGLVELYLKRIEAYNKSGPSLNAVQNVNPRAVTDADRLDAAFRSSGVTGPLHCVPVLIKDQVETRDMPTTYGSILFKDFVPERDATVVVRLKKAGALILGKTTMGEFASGFLGSGFGAVRNAYDPRRAASGSSGGTGAGIAANLAVLGIGEDTGGSVRGPAAVNSLVGLRPTTPLVSRFGMLPSRPSADTLGPIARTVRDAALLLDAMAGYDPQDPITAYAYGQVPEEYDSYTDALSVTGLRGVRLGIIRAPMDPKADPSSEDYKKFRAVSDQALREMKALGAEIVDPVVIPDLKERVTRLYEGNVFETEKATNDYFAQHPKAPVKTLAAIVESGKVVPSRVGSLKASVGKSVHEAGYADVLLGQEELRRAVLTAMAENRLDALVYATFDQPPPIIPENALSDPNLNTQGAGNNRRLSPLLGFPALTVPGGFTTDGLPVGIEFMARPFSEGSLLTFGYAYEQGTHHRKAPASAKALAGEP